MALVYVLYVVTLKPHEKFHRMNRKHCVPLLTSIYIEKADIYLFMIVMAFTIFALSAGFQRPKINIGNTGNQNHPDFLVTCIFNIVFLSWKPADNAKMVNGFGHVTSSQH